MSVKAMRALAHPQQRPVSDWEDAEVNALEWTRWLGFAGARRTSSGADRGLDIEGPGVFGQVKFHGRAIAPNLIQQLFGARGRREGEMLFFSNSGYTEAALDCANDLGVSCFRYSPADGRISPCNVLARNIMQETQSPTEVRENRSSCSAESSLIDGGCVEFSPDGSMIAYKKSPTSVHVEAFPSRSAIAIFDADSEVLGLEFSAPNSLAIHLPFLNETAIWDVRANAVLRTIGERPEERTGFVNMRQVGCNGQVLIAKDEDALGERLELWSTHTGDREDSFRFSGTSSAGSSLVAWGLSPKRVLVTCVCKGSGKMRSWHLRIADQSHQIYPGDRDGALQHFAFTSDGGLLAAVGETPQIDLWDLDQAKRVGVLRTSNPILEEEDDSLTAVAFSADDSLLAVAGYDKTVRLWSMPLREEIALLKGCIEDIEKINFSPDGRYLVASDESGTARLWDLADLT